MDNIVPFLNQQPLLALAIIIVLGISLGSIRAYGFALGTSGILFIAMALGHFGVVMPTIFGDLGVVLFVYAVGLQAGPHFVNTVRRRGWSFLLLALLTLGTAWMAVFFVAKWLGINAALASGIYAGALTSTPGLAASLSAMDDPQVSVGFGVAYPFGVICVLMFVQVMPKLLRINWKKEIALANASEAQPKIEHCWIQLTNPQVDGRTIFEVESMNMSAAIISRVLDKYVAMPPLATTHLCVGQHLQVVGTQSDLQKMEMLLGPRDENFKEPRSTITSATLVVSEHTICGQTLESLQFRERYGLTITRIWRDQFEFVPNGKSMLEFGDEIRVVGDVSDCERITTIVGSKAERLNETNFLPLGIGLLIGVILASFKIPVYQGQSISLGLAGGPLVAGLVAGHFGRIGRINFRMPVAARLFTSELGLILFLGTAGVQAGASFWSVVQAQGLALIAVALLATLVPLVVAFILARYVFKWDALHCLGAICGSMTSTPGLGAVTKMTSNPVPSRAYVAVYPMALLAVLLLAPLLGMVLGW